MKNNQTLQQPITQSRQRGTQATSAHLNCCGADPPSSWPTHVAGHKGHPPKQGHIFAIFAGFLFRQYGLFIFTTQRRSHPDFQK